MFLVDEDFEDMTVTSTTGITLKGYFFKIPIEEFQYKTIVVGEFR